MADNLPRIIFEPAEYFSVGDECTIEGFHWTVTAVSDEDGVRFAPGWEPKPRKAKGWRKHMRREKSHG